MDTSRRAYAVVTRAGKWTYYIVKQYRPYQRKDGVWVWEYVKDLSVTNSRSPDKARCRGESLGLIVNPGIGSLHNHIIQVAEKV